MSDRIEQRLRELRAELRTGQEELARLERRRSEVRDTSLRIAGAIQVLEEFRNDVAADSRAARLSALPR